MTFLTDTDSPVTNLTIILPKNDHSFLTTAAVGSGETGIVRTPSYRFRAAHVLNAGTEVLLDKNDEVRVDVVYSRPQSLCIEGYMNGEKFRTYVDRTRLLIDGTRQIAECKASMSDFYRPRAIRQRLLGQAAAEALGWEWLPVVPETLGTRIERANVDRIYGARGVRVQDHLVAHTVQLLASGGMTLGKLAVALGDHEGNGYSMAFAMMVRRIIEIDLTKPIGHASPVRLAPAIPRGLPSIRLRRGELPFIR